MRAIVSARLDSVSVGCKSICLVQSQYSGDGYASAFYGRRAAAVFVCHSCSHPAKLGNWRSFVNRNCPVSVGGSVRGSGSEQKTEIKTGNGMKAAFLAMAVLAAAGVVFYFSTTVSAKAGGTEASAQEALASKSRSKSRTMSLAKAISLPLFFEPNQGQTAPQVKFLARGAGYGLFLTADEAVLKLQHSALSSQHSAPRSQPVSSSVIRMKLEDANSAASVSGAEPLPGKSNYFIGNDPAKWRHNIPQFARVEYKSVYPGVDLVYYGDQGQLEYDFRVAPAADPNRIALSFSGASTRIESGDLILATDQGDVRFHAPRIYQQDGNGQKPIAGSFRQLADNKIGFTIGDYDHSRE